MIIRDEHGLKSDSGKPITSEEYAQYLRQHPNEARKSELPDNIVEGSDEDADLSDHADAAEDQSDESDDLWPYQGYETFDELLAQSGITQKAKHAIRTFLDDLVIPSADVSASDCEHYMNWLTHYIADAIACYEPFRGTSGLGDELHTVGRIDVPPAQVHAAQLRIDLEALGDLLLSIGARRDITSPQSRAASDQRELL
jgi:hypothetical protein